MIQESVQRLLDRVKDGEDTHMSIFSPSIYMAPGVLRDLSPSSFNPRLVSIGPLHRGDENVQAFEGQKVSYLRTLLSRIRVPKEEILESCMHKVYASMERIKTCYVWTKTFDDGEIAEIMVMDACFILELILKICEYGSFSGKALILQTVMCDLVLLENQIPFFILDQMFQCTILKFEPDASLIELIHPLLSCHNLFEADINTKSISINTTHHILSLLHQCYTPPNSIIPDFVRSRIHSVVDLDMAGVNFKPNQNSTSTWMMGMEVELYRFPCFFGSWGKPTFRMPVLKVHDFTESVLRNLISYEQSGLTHTYITSYAYAMDMLVNTQEDVAKLVGSRVLVNYMGSNQEVANMINGLCKEIASVDSFYEEQWKTLNEYCNSYWPKHIAKMRSTYFSSPWSIIALIAGIILFALAVVQTIFTIKSTGSNK